MSSLNTSSEETKKDTTTKELKIFVHGLHPYTTLSDIYDCFSKYANIYNIQFHKDSITGKHNGYAFFSVKTKEDAHKLINQRHSLNGRTIHCDFKYNDVKDQRENQKKRVFVGGIPKITSDEEIIQIFEKFGEIRAAYSIKDLSGRNRGYGFVDFADVETAQRVLAMKNLEIKGRIVDLRPYKKKNKNRLKDDDFKMGNMRPNKQNNNEIIKGRFSKEKIFNSNLDQLTNFEGSRKRELRFRNDYSNKHSFPVNICNDSMFEKTRFPNQKNQVKNFEFCQYSFNAPLIPAIPRQGYFLEPFMNNKGEIILDLKRKMASCFMNNMIDLGYYYQREINNIERRMESEGYLLDVECLRF